MARKHNVVVVGAGLFGSIAATLARAQGHSVTVVGADLPGGASKASGCVLAPSWLSSLSSEQIATAMDVLGGLYAVHDVEFKTNLFKTFRAQRIDPQDVLVTPDVREEVVEVRDGAVVTDSGKVLRGKVLVAAGIGTDRLVHMPAIKALWGASAVFSGTLPEPRIHVYAPYRQAVAFQLRGNAVWMGDGTALITTTWEKESVQRQADTVARGASLFGLKSKPRVTVGARPYVPGHKAGYFARAMPNVWVSTGGAKNGTVLAAWQAYQFVKELT